MKQQNFKFNLKYILNPEEFKCDVCKKEFKTIYKLKRHHSVHQLPTSCYFCGKYIKINGRIDLARQHLKFCKSFIKKIDIQKKDVYMLTKSTSQANQKVLKDIYDFKLIN